MRRETWCLSSSLYPIINNFSPSSFVPWNVHLRKMSVTFFSENTYHRLWIIKRSREPKNIYSELIGKTVQAFKTDLMISTIIFSVSAWFLQAPPTAGDCSRAWWPVQGNNRSQCLLRAEKMHRHPPPPRPGTEIIFIFVRSYNIWVVIQTSASSLYVLQQIDANPAHDNQLTHFLRHTCHNCCNE